MDIKVKITKPVIPDHVFYDRPSGQSLVGVTNGNSIRIEDLSYDQALEYAQLMQQGFIEKWREKQSQSFQPIVYTKVNRP